MLQVQAISPDLLLTARKIFSLPWSKDFLLVGGTNVALQLGHRLSVDIDLFTNKEFEVRSMVQHFEKDIGIAPERLHESDVGFRAILEGGSIVVDMFHTDVPMAGEPVHGEGLRLANLLDVAAMKIEAMVQRRVKKDYVDMYFIFKELDPQKCLEHFHQVDKYCSPQSVTFALDEVNTAAANSSDMPKMLKPVSWEEIQNLFQQVSREYSKKRVFTKRRDP